MANKNIGYQTRAYADSSIEFLHRGSFGGSIDEETINRLVNVNFTVTIKPSGRAVFIDRSGREVWLHITVDPERTIKGAEALKQWRITKAKENKEREARTEQEREEIKNLLDGLTYTEIIQKLKS